MFTVLLVLLLGAGLQAQSASPEDEQIPDGRWGGVLQQGKMRLDVFFTFTPDSSGTVWRAWMDVPQQGLRRYPLQGAMFDPDSALFRFEADAFGMDYEGILKNDTIRGVFRQNGVSFSLDLVRMIDSGTAPVRPQTPRPPFPYYSEDVVFHYKPQGVTLTGTLTLPDRKFKGPVAVLVSGSGQQDRDETVFDHKPFWVLADYLARIGIGTLRYDDRGVGGSTGPLEEATSYDFSLDAEAAVDYLYKRKFKRVGMIGHSEGGMIIPMVAERRPELSFVILLAAPGIRIDSLMLLQQQAVAESMGYEDSYIRYQWEANEPVLALIRSDMPVEAMQDTLKYRIRLSMGSDYPDDAFENEQQEELVERQLYQLMLPWFRYFIRYNPDEVLEKVRCPVLALSGSKDIQVVSGPNMAGIRRALERGVNKTYEVEIFPGLNHLFQHCQDCTIAEYGELEETMNEAVLKKIGSWILGLE